MDTSLFENFMALSETLSFTKAAEKLYKSESVLSRQISKFESIIDCRLFVRNSKTVSLTPAGVVLRDGLSKMRQDYDALLKEVYAIRDGHSGLIVIGLAHGVRLHDNLFKLITEFSREYPDVHIDLRTCELEEMRELLINQNVDFIYGVVDDFNVDSALSCKYIGSAKNFIVIPHDHPMASKKASEISLIDFKDDTFLFFEHQTKAIKLFSKRCEDAGFQLKYKTVPDSSRMSFLLGLHKGIVLSEETNMYRFYGDSVLLPISGLGTLRMGIVWNNAVSKGCSKAFLDYVESRSDLYAPKAQPDEA